MNFLRFNITLNIVLGLWLIDDLCSHVNCQVGRAGRFGTKGLAITFVSSAGDSEVLNQVSEVDFHGDLRFNVFTPIEKMERKGALLTNNALINKYLNYDDFRCNLGSRLI